jgi:SAM-dependent methyltransferase
VVEREVVNTEQAEAWNTDEGVHWAAHAERYDAMSAAFNQPLLDAAAIGETDSVLDVGCGNGQTTRLAARRASRGTAVGLDLSGPMLARARHLAVAEGLANTVFEQGDAQVHTFAPALFDMAISRFGVMFFADPVAAFRDVGKALRPGGRLAFVCWQELSRNEWLLVPVGAALEHVPMPDLGPSGAPGPFSLAEPDHIQDVLGSAGFERVLVTALDGQIRLGDDANDAIGFLRGTSMARVLLDQADQAAATRALDAVTEALRAHEAPEGLYLNGALGLSRPATGPSCHGEDLAVIADSFGVPRDSVTLVHGPASRRKLFHIELGKDDEETLMELLRQLLAGET